MAYIVFSKWTPRSAQIPSAGYITLSEVQHMANDPAYLREVTGPVAGSDAELQAICYNYLTGYNIAANLIASVGQVLGYTRKSSNPDLVITLMHFSSEIYFDAVESSSDWPVYIAARNALLDMLSVRMEVKQYTSADPNTWNNLMSKSADELSVIFDSIPNAEFITYP